MSIAPVGILSTDFFFLARLESTHDMLRDAVLRCEDPVFVMEFLNSLPEGALENERDTDETTSTLTCALYKGSSHPMTLLAQMPLNERDMGLRLGAQVNGDFPYPEQVIAGLLSKGARPSYWSLIFALKGGNPPVVIDLLLRAGAPVSFEVEASPAETLREAARLGYPADTLRVLWEHGATMDQLELNDEVVEAIDGGASEETVRFFLDCGAHIEEDADWLMHKALKNRYSFETMEMLLDAGAERICLFQDLSLPDLDPRVRLLIESFSHIENFEEDDAITSQ